MRTGKRSLRRETHVVLLEYAVGTIARAHERIRDDLEEATREAPLSIQLELLRRHIALDRQMVRRRAQVLAERHDVDLGVLQVVERLEDLVVRLAEPEHEARLRYSARAERLPVADTASRLS